MLGCLCAATLVTGGVVVVVAVAAVAAGSGTEGPLKKVEKGSHCCSKTTGGCGAVTGNCKTHSHKTTEPPGGGGGGGHDDRGGRGRGRSVSDAVAEGGMKDPSGAGC